MEDGMNCGLSMNMQIGGDATDSIFPQVEALFFASLECQNALKYVARKKEMNNYTSVVDFLFCELHPKWKIPCRKYYAGNGPVLKELISMPELLESNSRMLVALDVAQKLHHESDCRSWAQFQGDVKSAYDLAA